MDWNNDGKVDGRDSALFHSEISSGGSGGGSLGGGSGCSFGCWTWILIGAIVFETLKWIAGMIY